jgi:hypothetical protein
MLLRCIQDDAFCKIAAGSNCRSPAVGVGRWRCGGTGELQACNLFLRGAGAPVYGTTVTTAPNPEGQAMQRSARHMQHNCAEKAKTTPLLAPCNCDRAVQQLFVAAADPTERCAACRHRSGAQPCAPATAGRAMRPGVDCRWVPTSPKLPTSARISRPRVSGTAFRCVNFSAAPSRPPRSPARASRFDPRFRPPLQRPRDQPP